MILGPTDYLLRLALNQIGTLDEASFEARMPELPADAYTIVFWFQAGEMKGARVLVSSGNSSASQEGWSLLLREGSLVFRVRFDGHHSLEHFIPLPGGGAWHHFAGVVDQSSQRIVSFLNGAMDGWQDGESNLSNEPGSNADDRRLIIGGYTDAAGGHFDHTFGRHGTGLVDDFRIYGRALSADEIASFLVRGERLPVAAFEHIVVGEQSTVRFDATNSQGGDARILFHYWDFGDGQFASGSDVFHKYAHDGTYRVRLKVIDGYHTQDEAEQVVIIQGGQKPLRITPVFVNGAEGYACCRIPSIVRATNGDLIAFAEGRLAECSDSTQVIRIVYKRSGDNGQSWGPLQVVARNLLGNEEYGCMNPSPVVDTVLGTGRIVVVYNKKEYSEWDIARGKGVNRTFCIFSDDNGLTWHNEKDITTSVHKPYNPGYVTSYPDAARPENESANWRKQVPLPGHAIQLLGTASNPVTRGRLFFAGSYTIGDDSVFDALNYAFWSDDLGHTWQMGDTVFARQDGSNAKGLNETMAVELESGDVMLNSRNYQNEQVVGRRAVAIGSFDEAGNLSFQPAYHDQALVDSGVQASLIRYTRGDEKQSGGRSRILFANPNHPGARVNMTVRMSYDEGQTWPVSKVIDPGPSAYCDLVVQADMKIGLLYERGNQGGIAYTSFTLQWLTGGHDSLAAPESADLA